MQDPRVEISLIKDLKPGMKSLNMIFIILEVGEWINLLLPLLHVLFNLMNSPTRSAQRH